MGKRKLFVRILSFIAHEYNISHGRVANVLIRMCFVQKRKLNTITKKQQIRFKFFYLYFSVRIPLSFDIYLRRLLYLIVVVLLSLHSGRVETHITRDCF